MISSSELWFYPFEELNLNFVWYILNAILILPTNDPPSPNRRFDPSLIAECSLHYIKVDSELLKGSFNPVLFGPRYLKLLKVKIKINSKTTSRMSSIQGNLVLLSLALLYLSLVLFYFIYNIILTIVSFNDFFHCQKLFLI